MDDTDVVRRLRAAGEERLANLDAAPIRRRGAALRRRRQALRSCALVAASSLLVLSGLIVGRQSAPTVVVSASPPPPPVDSKRDLPENASDANQQIIDSLPVVANTRFSTYSHLEGPSGDGSLISYVSFRATSDAFTTTDVLDAFRQLEHWHLESEREYATRISLKLSRGDAYLGVDAFPTHGYSVVVASKEARILLKTTG